MSLCQCTVKHSESEPEGCCSPPGGGGSLKISLHWGGPEERERCQSYTQGTPSAEEICIDLARRIGEPGAVPLRLHHLVPSSLVPPSSPFCS